MFLTEYFTSVRVPDSATCHLRTPPPLSASPSSLYAPSMTLLCRPPGSNLTSNDPHGPRLVKLHGDTLLNFAMGNCTEKGPGIGPHELSSTVSLHLF